MRDEAAEADLRLNDNKLKASRIAQLLDNLSDETMQKAKALITWRKSLFALPL